MNARSEETKNETLAYLKTLKEEMKKFTDHNFEFDNIMKKKTPEFKQAENKYDLSYKLLCDKDKNKPEHLKNPNVKHFNSNNTSNISNNNNNNNKNALGSNNDYSSNNVGNSPSNDYDNDNSFQYNSSNYGIVNNNNNNYNNLSSNDISKSNLININNGIDKDFETFSNINENINNHNDFSSHSKYGIKNYNYKSTTNYDHDSINITKLSDNCCKKENFENKNLDLVLLLIL